MRQERPVPGWLAYVDLGCAATAGAAWYVHPEWGPWPLLLVFAPWVVRWILTGRPTRRTPLDLPLVLFLATAALGLWTAFHQETAWAKFWLIVGAVAIYYALANQPTSHNLRLFVVLLALFGAGVAIYFPWTNRWDMFKAKIDFLNMIGESIQAALPYLPGPRFHPNVVGGILVMIVPFQLSLVGASQANETQIRVNGSKALRRLGRWVGTATLGLTIVGLVFTTSRGAWLSLGMSLGLWALWRASSTPLFRVSLRRNQGTENRVFDPRAIIADLFSSPMDNSTEGRFGEADRDHLRRFVTWIAAIMLSLGLGLLLLPDSPQSVLALVPGPNRLPERLALWSRALYLIQDTPFTGGGLGSFPALDSAYVYPITRWNRYYRDIAVPNAHAHNLWFDVAVEQGLPGLIALLWLQGVFVIQVWRGRSRSQCASCRQNKLLVEASVASILAITIHSLVNDSLYCSGGMLLFFVPMGIVTALSPGWKPKFATTTQRITMAGIVLVSSLMFLASRNPLLAIWQADLGAVKQAKVELAGYLDEGYKLSQARAEGDYGPASAYFEEALALEPGQPTASLRLGLIWLGKGEGDVAIPLLEQAYRIQPGRQAACQALAEAYLIAGRLDESVELWATVDEADVKLRQLIGVYQADGEEKRAGDAAWVADQVRRKLMVGE